MFKGFLEAATSDLDCLLGWSNRYPGCNWSVVPAGSGIWALDIDAPSVDHTADGVTAFRKLCVQNGGLPPLPHGRSGGGGHLLVFRDAGHPIRTKTGSPCPGIDPRAGRLPFTVAPSIHRRGGHYRWVVAPWDIAPPITPAWLLRELAPAPTVPAPHRRGSFAGTQAQWRLMGALNRVQRADPGERNTTLNREAFRLGRLVAAGIADPTSSVTALYRAARFAGLDDAECKATIRSGFEAGLKYPLAR